MRALFACILFACPHTAWPQSADTLTLRAEGFADGIGFAARARAIKAAEQDAVAQFLGTIVASEDLSEAETLLLRASDYVEGTEVIRCDQQGDATRVEIDARIAEKRLTRDIAEFFLPRLPAPPRILLVIGEQVCPDNIPAVLPDGTGEKALKEALQKKGFQVSGVDTVESLYSHPDLVRFVTGDIETASAFARGAPEDVVAVGTAIAQPYALAPGSNLLRNEAVITLRVFRSFDGKMVDAVTLRHAVHAIDAHEGSVQAVSDACKKIAGDIVVAAVLTVLGTRMGSDIQLTVENPGQRSRLDALLSLLQNVPGVAVVEELFFAPHLARISFAYTGPLPYLVDVLRDRVLEGATLRIRRVVVREMRLAFE